MKMWLKCKSDPANNQVPFATKQANAIIAQCKTTRSNFIKYVTVKSMVRMR
jgi:hypothetical protein